MAKITSTPASSISADVLGYDSSSQEMDLGAKLVDNMGRIYRYCKVGAVAIVPGKLYDGPAEIANHQNVTCAVAAAGATSITVTLGATAATANQYTDGVIVINDVDGQGFTYGIESHPAADASATLALTLKEGEEVITATTTSSQATLVPNQYNGIIVHAATETGVPVGVGVSAVTAAQFGFIQTGGAVGILHDATVAEVGLPAAASTTTIGAVTLGTGALKEIGTMLATGVSTEYNPVYMTLDT